MMRGIHHNEKRSPAPVPMALDVGRLVARDVTTLGAIALGCLFVGTLGGFLFWAALPAAPGAWVGLRFWLVLFGGCVAVFGFGLAVVVARFALVDWSSYHRRLEDWHQAALEAYEGSGGQVSETTTTAWELSATNPRDVLLLALSLHADYESGETTPHALTKSAGQRWLGQGSSHVRLGDLTRSQAEQAGKTLATMGLIAGRGEKRAGVWVPRSYDEVIRLVYEGWKRVE